MTFVEIRVLVVGSSPIRREGVCTLLRRQKGLAVTGCTEDGSNVVDEVRRLQPDVLLLDADGGSSRWPRILSKLAQLPYEVKTVLLSRNFSDRNVLEAIELAARGLVPANATTETLCKGIRCVAAGEYWLGRERIADALDYMKARNSRKRLGDSGLTVREKDVLRGVLRGYANSDIAAQLSVSNQAVRHILSRIFRKLSVSSRLELALVARKRGLLASPVDK